MYPLSSLDHKLLEESVGVLDRYSEGIVKSPLGKEIEKIVESNSITWDQYMVAAAAANNGLSINKKGMSLIDFMDDEPTQRAYADGVDPTDLRRIFREQFDITTFGTS